MNGVRAALVITCFSAALACAGTKAAEEPVATVNGNPIYDREVQAKMMPVVDRIKQENPRALGEGVLRSISAKALDYLIERELALTSEKARAVRQGSNGIDEDGVIALMKQDLAKSCNPCTRKEAQALYDKEKGRFTSGGRIKVSLILLDPDRLETDNVKRLATGIVNRVFEAPDEEWNACAMDYSSGPKAAAGGHWDWTKASELPGGIGKSVLQMTVGEVSKLPVGDLLYIVRLDEKEPTRQLGLDEAMVLVEKEVMRRKAEAAWRDWMQTERKKASIEVKRPL